MTVTSHQTPPQAIRETSAEAATLIGPAVPRQDELFTPGALAFLATLHSEFAARLHRLSSQKDSTGAAPVDTTQFWTRLVEQHLTEPPSSFISPRRLSRTQDKVTTSEAPLSAGVVDFGLPIYRNAQRLLEQGRSPFVSLPETETEEELQIWQDLLDRAEQLLELPDGAIRAMYLRPGEPDMDDDEDGQASSERVLMQRAGR